MPTESLPDRTPESASFFLARENDHLGGFRAWIPERSDFFKGPKGPWARSEATFLRGPKAPRAPWARSEATF